MKSPELRKELSELVLHKRGIRLNLQQAVIESEDEITVRDLPSVWRRLQALTLTELYRSQQLTQQQAQTLLQDEELTQALSQAEQNALNDTATDWQQALPESRHALRFLGWCCGLQKQLGMPEPRKNDDDLAALCARITVTGGQAAPVLVMRSKSELLDWADLLYRLHWAVRHAQLMDKPVPGRLDAQAVSGWHKAINWLICYEDQDDWDLVSTETAG